MSYNVYFGYLALMLNHKLDNGYKKSLYPINSRLEDRIKEFLQLELPMIQVLNKNHSHFQILKIIYRHQHHFSPKYFGTSSKGRFGRQVELGAFWRGYSKVKPPIFQNWAIWLGQNYQVQETKEELLGRITQKINLKRRDYQARTGLFKNLFFKENSYFKLKLLGRKALLGDFVGILDRRMELA